MKATVLGLEKELLHGVGRLAFPCPETGRQLRTIRSTTLHTNSNEQWLSVVDGLVMDKITAKQVPNVADVIPTP
jgi:hypothetical protein